MESAVKAIESAVKLYLQDMEVMTEEQIMSSAGGSARKAVDFTFETALINLRISARIKGEEPPAEPEGDWWEAPEEIRSKAAIVNYFKLAGDDLIAAARGTTEEDASRQVGAPGRERPIFSIVQFAAMHTMYHDAQLNFIQSLAGDLEMHW